MHTQYRGTWRHPDPGSLVHSTQGKHHPRVETAAPAQKEKRRLDAQRRAITNKALPRGERAYP
jgi:hypothetical protein